MAKTQDLLLELGCEELPAKQIMKLGSSLRDGINQGLDDANLARGESQLFATPRRLAVLITDIPVSQSAKEIEKRGPALDKAYDKDGKPTPAALGFARSCGVEISELGKLETDKGAWLMHKALVEGKTTLSLLPSIFSQVIKRLPLPKSMRWGDNNERFLRPVQWIVALFGSDVVPCELLGVQAGCESYGHRIHAPKAFKIKKPRDYNDLCLKAFVVADPVARRNIIEEKSLELAKKHNVTVVIENELLDEVTGINEWPTPLLCDFDETFLKAPAEALIAAMRDHQKCFYITDSDGKLLPHFITVANIESPKPELVKQGNERVMRARLADAAFFFATDKQTPLHTRLSQLEAITFHEQLGSLHDKAERLAHIAKFLAEKLSLDHDTAARAALLAKCDLATDMVGEFPELQGIMGYYYALADNEEQEIAIAIRDQYHPRFAGDSLPESTFGSIISLADKFDELVANFALKQIPTGEKDPFGLRRKALGIIRIISEQRLPISVSDCLTATAQAFNLHMPVSNDVLNQVHQFIVDRLHAYFNAQNFSSDSLQAVLAREQDDIFDIQLRLNAVKAFRNREEATSLAAAFKRVNRILEKEAEGLNLNHVDPKLLEVPAENHLFDALNSMQERVNPLFSKQDYSQGLNELASLRDPVDQFFDQVMVMVDDRKVCHNRLALLTELRELFLQVADISLLQW